MHLPKINRSQKWIKRLQAGVIGLVLGSIISILIKIWDQILQLINNFNPILLLFSISLVTLLILAWAFVWSWLLQHINGSHQPIYQTASIYIYGNAAKYIPGSIWNFFARAHLGSKAGFGQAQVWIANIAEFMGGVITGLLLYSFSLLWPHSHQPIISPFLLLGLCAILFAIFSPPSLIWIHHFIQKKRKIDGEDNRVSFPFSKYFIYFLASCLEWIFVGIGFFIFIKSLYPITWHYLPEAVGAWSIAVSAGMLAIGFPQGLGVKEGILTIILSSTLPLPIALSLVALSRAWTIICDLFALAIWGLIDKVWLRHMVILYPPATESVQLTRKD